MPSIPTRRYGSSYVASLGRTPWYLLTAEPISTDEDAWRVVFTYMRSFQIELTWRFNKSELAFQSPRLWRRVRAPLYRLRSALSRLWQRYPPCFAALGRPRRTQALVTFT